MELVQGLLEDMLVLDQLLEALVKVDLMQVHLDMVPPAVELVELAQE